MDKKIVTLLSSNLRVIIPDFGAFIIRQQEPRIVVFNELLKGNDGLLTEFIKKTEGVETEVAEQLLSDFTSQSLRTLESGGILTIEGLGTLQKDKDGTLAFTQEAELFTLDEPEIIADDAAKTIVKKPTSKSSEKKPAVTAVNVKKAKISPESEKISSGQMPQPAEKKVTAAEAPIVAKAGKRILQEKRTFPVLLLRAGPGDKPGKKFFQPGIVIKWAVGILLANLVVFFIFSIKNDKNRKPEKEKVTVGFASSVTDRLNDSVMAAIADTSASLQEDPVTPLDANETVEQGNLRYYIVAGCFRDEVNADELVTSLKKSGYKAEKFGKIGDLYAVSFASFDNKDLAVKELARIREEFHPDAWMTRF